jgi:hypothetical protein
MSVAAVLHASFMLLLLYHSMGKKKPSCTASDCARMEVGGRLALTIKIGNAKNAPLHGQI